MVVEKLTCCVEPRVEVGPYDCGLYMPGDETSVSIPIPHLLPSDHLPLKEEQQKLVIETPKKCKNAKRKRNMDAPSATTKKPQLSCMKSVPKKSKASRPAKRVKVTQVEETEKTKKAKKSHKRQRVTKAERNRLKTEYERFVSVETYLNPCLRKSCLSAYTDTLSESGISAKDEESSGGKLPVPVSRVFLQVTKVSLKQVNPKFFVDRCCSMDMLKDHMELHKAGQKRHFLCTECKEVFYSSGCLTSHAITHSRGGSTKFCCQAVGCGKRYATAEGLRLHTRNHHQVNKTWKCMAENCDISFVRKSDLQMHIIRMHSKERPYPCTQKGCAKSFACHSGKRDRCNQF